MRTLPIAIALLWPGLVCGQVYKQVDPDGRVQYTDHAVTGAKPVNIPTKRTPSQSPGPATDKASPGPYNEFDILTPAQGATVQSADGTVQIGLVLDPPLLAGQKLQIVLDGSAVPGEVPGTQLVIQQLPLGSHDVRAKILDESGTAVASTAVVRFHVRKPENP